MKLIRFTIVAIWLLPIAFAFGLLCPRLAKSIGFALRDAAKCFTDLRAEDATP